jgi:predicted transcriptional regulator
LEKARQSPKQTAKVPELVFQSVGEGSLLSPRNGRLLKANCDGDVRTPERQQL